MNSSDQPRGRTLDRERYELLRRLENLLEVPMIVLGLAWLVLLIVELISELSPVLKMINSVIWVLFVVDFLIKFILAPRKVPFLKKNILTIISLALPALRVLRLTRIFRLVRTVRAVRGLRLVKVIGSLNRGMRSLGATMQRRGFGYVLVFTLVVLFTGAAGMYAFEKDQPEGLQTYGEALWWTAMILITVGSQYWPQSPEGQVLCFLLALYAFTVFGYFTATLATFFVGRDAENSEAEIAGAKQMGDLQQEIRLLRQEIRQLLPDQSDKTSGRFHPPGES